MAYNTIILSGLPGSGKSTLLKNLAEIYNWEKYSIGDMWRARWKEEYPRGEVLFEEFWRTTTIEDNRRINEEALEIMRRGKTIWDSRFSVYYTRNLPILQVFLHTDLRVRAQRAIETSKYGKDKTEEEIAEILTAREQDEVRMGRTLYGADFDYRFQNLYHLRLDSSRLSIDKELQMIGSRMNF